MAYESRQLGRQKVRYNDDNDDNVLTYQLVLDGAKATPTAGEDNNTITIYKPGSSTAVLAATDMTISGTLLTYAVDTTTTANFPIDTGYRADVQITTGGVAYLRHFLFDVVYRLADLEIGYDQLVAFDDGLRGMQWDGDSDFSEIINSFRDVLQMHIESKVIGDDQLIENMILDMSRVRVAARYGILAQVWHAKGDPERRDYYQQMYDSARDAVLSSIRYDKTQDGEEDSAIGGIQEVRLVT